MRLRRRSLIAAVALLVALALSVPALAASGKAGPKHAKLLVKGGVSFKPNQFIKDGQHWTPGTVVIASGGTLTIVNKAKTDEPHTFSIVKKSDLPRTVAQVENCAICGDIAKSHGVDPTAPPSGPPPILTVDTGNDGFNAPGDSQFFGPHQTVKVKITAKRGAKLYFMCAVHPWMQGVVKVR